MFTGIVEELGTVREAAAERLVVGAGIVLADTKDGDSLAVNGVCLTVVERTGDSFAVDLSAETLARTNLGSLKAGDQVDLERPLTPASRMGGHVVQGHVDGVAELIRCTREADALLLDFLVPDDVYAVTVLHGSIALGGVSLMVNALGEAGVVQVSIIPYTAEQTTLGSLPVGDRVHVESDMLGKLVKRLLQSDAEAPSGDGA